LSLIARRRRSATKFAQRCTPARGGHVRLNGRRQKSTGRPPKDFRQAILKRPQLPAPDSYPTTAIPARRRGSARRRRSPPRPRRANPRAGAIWLRFGGRCRCTAIGLGPPRAARVPGHCNRRGQVGPAPKAPSPGAAPTTRRRAADGRHSPLRAVRVLVPGAHRRRANPA
jgi:hypothetical protein